VVLTRFGPGGALDESFGAANDDFLVGRVLGA